MATIGERIRELRLNLNETQEECARCLNIKRSRLAMYEQGKRVPKDVLMIKIANHFGVPLDYLLGRINDPYEHIMMETEKEQLLDIAIHDRVFADFCDQYRKKDGFDVLKLFQEYLENEVPEEWKRIQNEYADMLYKFSIVE